MTESGYGGVEFGIGGFGVDVKGCLITPISPTQDETGVAVDSRISFTIEDEDLVRSETIVVEVNRGSGFETAFRYVDVPQFKTGWDGPASDISESDGKYTVVIDPTPDLGYSTVVQVRVTAADYTGNPERLP